MGDFLAFPPARRLSGSLRVPSSKSATNRALVLAALTASPVEIVRPLESDDTRVLARCLAAMGAAIVATGDGLRVSGPLGARGRGEILLDAGDSGTAARFLAAVASATPGDFLLDGSHRLRERPMGELVAALREAGARLESRGEPGRLPLAIQGGGLSAREVSVDASRSSQFVSALLLAAVAVDGGLRVRPAGAVVSGPYVASTLEVLQAFGHTASSADGVFAAARGRHVTERWTVPGDYSSAVPLVAAVGAAGGDVVLSGLRWPSTDADARALPVLAAMGVSVEPSPAGLRVRADRDALEPAVAAATEFPDAVPALAALAALAPGASVFSGIGHLRIKESDRLVALETLSRAAGASAEASEDGLRVTGPVPENVGTRRLPTFRDHRIAMAAGILAVRLPGILVEDPGCVAKSYPGFFRDLESLVQR
ncbi:MAG TPA: 3-phosphoshikimate 1-carboxyvinyltransferase [Thermoanaerobaculia bacterium]|nr:3-phosphoshikimate 1-carboxyvinyltransferase [Thermoanaerobaculia bacterium]